MRDRGTSRTPSRSRSYTGAAKILKPRSPAPSVHIKDIYNALARTTGLDPVRGFRHPLRGGGTMELPIGPKFPPWMGARMGPGVSTADYARQLENGRIQELLAALEGQGKQTFFDRANPLLSHRYPLATEKRFSRTPENSLPKKQLLEALGGMNQDNPLNRAFIKWMMKHHFGNKN